MPFRELFRDFCDKTSMKGVPRIVRTENGVLRGMWFLCVILFLTLTGYSVTRMVQEYYKRDVNINIMEQRIVFPQMADGIPAVTFCNLNRFNSNSSQVLQQEEKDTIIQLHDRINELMKKHNLDQYTTQELRSHMLSYRTYFEHLGDDVAEKVGHSMDVMFQECHVVCTDGLHTHNIPCKDVCEFNKTESPDFFNCYTLYPNAKALDIFSNWSWKGLSVVLFLDDLTEDQHEHESLINGYDVIGGGCEVTLHPPKAHPSSVHRTYKASAGTFTSIQVMPWVKSSLPSPYGKCYKKESTPAMLGPEGQPLKYMYTRKLCVQACMQLKVKDSCGCTDSAIPRCRESFPFCGDLNSNANANFSENSTLRCMVHVLGEPGIVNECYDSCLDPCEKYGEDVTLTSVPWPAMRQRNYFAKKICSGMGGQINIKNVNCSSKAEMDSTIKENFVKIAVEIPDLVVKMQKEVPRLTRASLWSQLGGAMNLYAGITLVVVVELLDLVYRWVISRTCLSVSSKTHDEKEKETSTTAV